METTKKYTSLHVLIVFQNSQQPKYSSEQMRILYYSFFKIIYSFTAYHEQLE